MEQACKIFPGLLYQIWLSCPHCQDVGIMLSFTVLSLLLPLLPPLSFRKEMFCIIFISTKIIWWDLRRACITHFQVLSWATGLQFLLVEKVDGFTVLLESVWSYNNLFSFFFWTTKIYTFVLLQLDHVSSPWPPLPPLFSLSYHSNATHTHKCYLDQNEHM